MLVNVETLAQFNEQDFRKMFPNVGFSDTIEAHQVEPLGYTVIEFDDAPALPEGGRLEPGELRREGERVIQAWKVIPPTEKELAGMFERAIQALLNDSAVARGYDSISTAISYAEEPEVERFQKDGIAFRKWRSLVWAYAYEQLAAVTSGDRAQPTVAEFITELPKLELPT
ncbi:hypothetical protein SAMN05216593_10144 [Pseudomonas asturiensis]|uniref:Uncharacterized protein n=1 Tax=Pseudomonas asturiensis TaxID=1190415 RepID=A0A1M7J111_9PSED|nr:hypothetical protein [Pseudomonas asturiensis]SHM46582.1 hypothetical protein SAMN05216593_10144 [Pseudomonas asturiensis]